MVANAKGSQVLLFEGCCLHIEYKQNIDSETGKVHDCPENGLTILFIYLLIYLFIMTAANLRL